MDDSGFCQLEMYKNLIFQNCVKRDDIVFVKLSMYRCALILKTDSMESAKLLTARALSAPMEGDESGKYWEEQTVLSTVRRGFAHAPP